MSNLTDTFNPPGAPSPLSACLQELKKIRELLKETKLGLPRILRNLEATTHRGLQDRYWRLEAMRDKAAILRAQNSTGLHEICKKLWDM
ncbi:uncharacterized protein N7473_004739 [Penicillium subrubescens]|uniref:Uncharacterized protein n=1 Tax=Penicillium subrubescens TaxID=1316194 RepID=A0A1Q5UHG8_9EURO|nr:uncharacterized protein N7473_004739 [Penicillium subrubescens]KAJ5900669.1 hypothetical protein N7473_004739 [Penicillium subrubescens]OKP11938.1 hypothetical protein PENSUB_2490 [Penicillium subrubescens]